MPERKDFATTGTESYQLEVEETKKDKIILTIEEEKPGGIILDKKKAKSAYTGNFIIDWYRRINGYFLDHSSIKPQAKAQFFHLLSVMVNAGVPVVTALQSLINQSHKSPRLQGILEDLADGIESGSSLSEALDAYNDVFTEQEIGMVQSGEASGQLNKVLENLAVDLEKAYKIRGKVKSAMTYPIIVFMLLIGVVTVMMIYVVPKLTQLFSSMEEGLPLITRVVVGISEFMVTNKTMMAVGSLGVILFLMLFKKTDVGKFTFDKFKISIPIFGNLFKQSYLSRFSRSLGNLLDSKISIVKTMEISANSIGNEVYRRRLLLSMEDIKQGIPLAESLTSSDLFPSMLVNMLEVGEKTAQMDEISVKLADFYENEVDTTVAGISKIIEPLVLVIIGGTVATVVAAIMLPIMKLSDIAGAM